MEEEVDLFTKVVAAEMMVDILSRLPMRSIMSCKCVCKAWLNVVESPELVKHRLSKSSLPSLAAYERRPNSNPMKPYELLEIAESSSYSDVDLGRVFNFSFPHDEPINSSVDGLLLLCSPRSNNNIFVCNPMTREYIKIPEPEPEPGSDLPPSEGFFGFGVSRRRREYKIVRINVDDEECKVHTLGTDSWRSITGPTCIGTGKEIYYRRHYPTRKLADYGVFAFVNGNLHWVAVDFAGNRVWICVLDLETEAVTSLSTPPLLVPGGFWALSAVGGRLCFCDHSSVYVMLVWSMKEYGDDKSWTKISHILDPRLLMGYVFPLEILEDGDMLLQQHARRDDGTLELVLFRYSNKNAKILLFASCGAMLVYTPTFLSLRTLVIDQNNVQSLVLDEVAVLEED